jgi:hypothetical protein
MAPETTRRLMPATTPAPRRKINNSHSGSEKEAS